MGDERRHGAARPALTQFVAQSEQKHVPDRPLGVAYGIVERDRRHLGDRHFGTAQNEPHLRTVAVRHDERMPSLRQVDELRGDGADGFILVGDRQMGLVANQGIAAQRDDNRCHTLFPSGVRVVCAHVDTGPGAAIIGPAPS